MVEQLPKQHSLTLKDAADYCHMSYPVFKDWFATGVIPSIPYRPGSKRRKVVIARLDEFLAWLETDAANEMKRSEIN